MEARVQLAVIGTVGANLELELLAELVLVSADVNHLQGDGIVVLLPHKTRAIRLLAGIALSIFVVKVTGVVSNQLRRGQI